MSEHTKKFQMALTPELYNELQEMKRERGGTMVGLIRSFIRFGLELTRSDVTVFIKEKGEIVRLKII